jgi:hypothetical protein
MLLAWAIAPEINSRAETVDDLDTDVMNQPESPQRFRVRRLVDDEVERVGAVLALARLYQGNGFYLVA